jgi:hypothetical protein
MLVAPCWHTRWPHARQRLACHPLPRRESSRRENRRVLQPCPLDGPNPNQLLHLFPTSHFTSPQEPSKWNAAARSRREVGNWQTLCPHIAVASSSSQHLPCSVLHRVYAPTCSCRPRQDCVESSSPPAALPPGRDAQPGGSHRPSAAAWSAQHRQVHPDCISRQ